MNTAVLRGSFTLGAADFSRRALLAGTVLLCARFLSTSIFGDYVFLLSFYQIFAVLGGAGLPSSLLRAVARNRQSGVRTGLASVLARLVYIVPTAAVMYVAMRLMGFSAQYFPALGLLVLMMVVRGAAENVTFIFQGREDQISCAKIGVSQSAVTLLATLTICLTSKDLLLLIGAHVLGGLVSAIYGFVLLRFKDKQERSGRIFREIRSLLRESHWLNAGTFVAASYNRVDVLLLRRLVTSDAVAIYGAPYRILDLTQIVPSSLMATILPSLCRNEEAKAGIAEPRTAMRFLLIVAACLIVCVTVAAPWITYLLFGSKYQGSIPVLQVLIWATVPMFWNFVLNAQLIANSFDRAILYAASIALLVNFGLNLLFIPRFGYMACAVITVVTEFALLWVNIYFVSKIGSAARPEKLPRLAMTIALVAGFCFFWTHPTYPHGFVGTLLVLLAVLCVPLSRNDFSASDVATRSEKVPKTRKRIGVDLLVLSQFSFTGIVTYTEWILPALIQSFPEHDWVLFIKSPELLKFDYRQFPNVEIKVSPWMKSDWLWKLVGASIEPRLERLDLMFIPVSRAPLMKSCPIILYLHDMGFLKHPESLLRGTFRRTAVAVKHAALAADVALTNSEFTKKEICSAYNIAESKVVITYYGFSQDKFNQKPADRADLERVLNKNGIHPPYVVYVGVLQGRKNLVRLIQAAELWRQTEPNLQLVLAGKRGWNCDDIYAAAAKFPREQVVLPGPMGADDLRVLYQRAECFVLPSIYEGFGIPIIEAMACGTPVALSRATVLPEVGRDAALYFDPENTAEIAARVLEIRASESLRAKMIRAGIARAAEFTWDACTRRTVRAFETVLNGHPKETKAQAMADRNVKPASPDEGSCQEIAP